MIVLTENQWNHVMTLLEYYREGLLESASPIYGDEYQEQADYIKQLVEDIVDNNAKNVIEFTLDEGESNE